MASDTEVRKPMNVRCGKCEHTWPAAYLPMDVSDMVKVTRNLHCPMCAAKSKDIFLAKSP